MKRKVKNEENEKFMVGPGKWRETWKHMQKTKHTLQELEYGEKTDQKEKQKQTLQDLEYGQKFDKGGK